MYPRAFSTLGCPDLSLDEVLALAVRHAVPGIEVRALGGRLDLPDYFRVHFGSPPALARHVAARGGRIVALDTSVRLIGASAGDRAALLAFLPWAEALGVRWLRVFDGGERLDAAAKAEAAETLAWWQEVRRGCRCEVDLMVETHDVLLDAARILEFAAAMPGGQIAVLWDTHHTWRKGGEAPLATWRAIRERVVHVHVKDSVSVARPPHAFTYVSPGEGEFPMAELRAVLATEYAGAVSLEWERLWRPDLAPLEDALSAATKTGWW